MTTSEREYRPDNCWPWPVEPCQADQMMAEEARKKEKDAERMAHKRAMDFWRTLERKFGR